MFSPPPEYLARPVGALHPEYAAQAYDELSFWSSRFGALLFDNLALRPNIRGLDVGCGAGFPLTELAQVHGPSCRFEGLDPWHDAVARARRKVAVLGLRNVEVHEGDAAQMPFADGTFDLITSNLGINNFAAPSAVLRECVRVARPGARVVLTTNVRGHMAGFYALFREVLAARGRGELLAALEAQEAHRGTRESVEGMVREAGLEVTRVVEGEFALRFVDGSAMFRHTLVQFFLDGWRSVVDERGVYEELEARLNAAGEVRERVPMLYVEAVRT